MSVLNTLEDYMCQDVYDEDLIYGVMDAVYLDVRLEELITNQHAIDMGLRPREVPSEFPAQGAYLIEGDDFTWNVVLWSPGVNSQHAHVSISKKKNDNSWTADVFSGHCFSPHHLYVVLQMLGCTEYMEGNKEG